jgi:hypothetical protein
MAKFTKQQPGKNHETSIGIAEGLPIGSVHPAHTKIKVPKMAPADTKTQKRAHGFNERSQNGNAEKMGGC